MSAIDAESLRAELRAAIAETDDAHARALLLLMLGLYDITADGFQAINDKIDNVLSNEKELRDKVLNGHSETFDPAMRWVKEEMAFSSRQKAINHWVEERITNGGHCTWAVEKMDQEKLSNRVGYEQRLKSMWGIGERVLWVILGYALMGYLHK